MELCAKGLYREKIYRKGKGMDVSRRDLLKGGAVVAAGLAMTAGISAVGCASAPAASTESWLPEKWDYETDIVVIGYGNAGSAAAVAANAAGAKTMVLEKAPHGGGNSQCAMGNCMGGWDDVDGMAEHLMAISYGTMTDKELCKSFVEQLNALPDELEELTDMAIRWDIEPGGPLPLGDARFPYLPGHDACVAGGKWVTDSDDLASVQMGSLTVYRAGDATFRHMNQFLESTDVEIKFSTPVKKLIQNPTTKEIVGVVAAEGASGIDGAGGTDVHIKANKGVIMACGGFENNQELYHQYARYSAPTLPCPPLGTPYNTGDGLIMAEEVGARMWHTATAETYNFTNVKAASDEFGCAISVAFPNAGIFVNRDGKRFMSEKFFSTHTHATFPFYNFTHTMSAPSGNDDTQIQDYCNVPYYLIFDSTTFDAGSLSHDIMGYNLIHGLYEWSSDNSAELEKGWIIKGETVEELAQNIKCTDSFDRVVGMDADGLVETINTFNASCAAGVDSEFGRYPNTLSPISTPPFYAIEVTPYVVNTWGGAKRNANGEILDVRDQVIPRLYGAGEFGSIFSEGYVGACNFPEALATGLTAGKNAAALEPWDAGSKK